MNSEQLFFERELGKKLGTNYLSVKNNKSDKCLRQIYFFLIRS